MRCYQKILVFLALTAVSFPPATAFAQAGRLGIPDRPALGREAEKPKENPVFARLAGASFDPIFGKIIWVDDSGKYAIFWLNDIAMPVPLERFLGARDNAMTPLALLRFSGQRNTRAIGVVIENGTVRVGDEIFLPSATALSRLNRKFPNVETKK